MSRAAIRLACLLSLGLPAAAGAQLTLTSAVDLALRNDPRVHAAQATVDKARAVLSEARDVYIPAVSTSGGYGKSTGVPLGLPVIFTIESRSLIYSAAQGDLIHAARQGLQAAEETLADVRNATAADVAVNYVALDNALRRRQALHTELATSERLVTITQERVNAGIEVPAENLRQRKTSVSLRLQQLTVDDEIDADAGHLGRLMGLPSFTPATVSASIPAFQPVQSYAADIGDSAGIRASFAQARAQQFNARGDRKYLFRPQVGLAVGYSRITVSDTESNYGVYYPNFTSENVSKYGLSLNALSVGFQITVPLIDYLHRAKARESAADAAHAFAEAEAQRMQFLEGRQKLHRTAAELELRVQLADLDQQLAAGQLAAVRAQLTAAAGASAGPQMSPEDEAKAQLNADALAVDALTAELQLRQTEVQLLQQNGSLAAWIGSSLAAAGSTVPAPSVSATP